MANRVIRTPDDLEQWFTFLRGQKMPMTVSKVAGADKTTRQNKTMFMWYGEIAEQRGDTSIEDQRAECKLRFGVPILRRDNPEWRTEYDALIRPLSYEMKLRIVKLMDWPVTRLMTTKQAAEYQDAILQEYTSQGFALTIPKDDAA